MATATAPLTDTAISADRPLSPKESQIIEAARRLFLEHGYEETSMDAIAAEAGVSKRTVYSHFRSKEMLFVEIMEAMCQHFGLTPQETIDPDSPPERYLCASAKFVLAKVMDPRMQSVMRTIAGEAAIFPEMGQRFWALGPGNMTAKITDYLRAQDAAGVLSVPDPRLSAGMFQGMVAGPTFLPMLFTGSAPWTPDDIDYIARTATAAFLVAHKPKQG